MPHKLHGTLLSAEEWRDNAQIWYGIRPSGLCDRCDECCAPFSVEHGLSCKKGVLVGLCHDVTRDEAGWLAAMGRNTSRVSYKPYIFHSTGVVAGQGSQREGSTSGGEGEGITRRTELGDVARGDVEVYGFWKKGEACVLDIQVTDTDVKSYAASLSEKCWRGPTRPRRRSTWTPAGNDGAPSRPWSTRSTGWCAKRRGPGRSVSPRSLLRRWIGATSKWSDSCAPGCRWRSSG
ncbi:hypothetical protein ACHAWF_000194 [Thalassiosira exigua]